MPQSQFDSVNAVDFTSDFNSSSPSENSLVAQIVDETRPPDHSMLSGVSRVGYVATAGTFDAVRDARLNWTEHVDDAAMGVGIGFGLGAVSRAGRFGPHAAAAAGGLMLGHWIYSEVTGDRWNGFSQAMSDSYFSSSNLEANRHVASKSLGTFAVDLGVTTLSGGMGFAGGRMVPQNWGPRAYNSIRANTIDLVSASGMRGPYLGEMAPAGSSRGIVLEQGRMVSSGESGAAAILADAGSGSRMAAVDIFAQAAELARPKARSGFSNLGDALAEANIARDAQIAQHRGTMEALMAENQQLATRRQSREVQGLGTEERAAALTEISTRREQIGVELTEAVRQYTGRADAIRADGSVVEPIPEAPRATRPQSSRPTSRAERATTQRPAQSEASPTTAQPLESSAASPTAVQPIETSAARPSAAEPVRSTAARPTESAGPNRTSEAPPVEAAARPAESTGANRPADRAQQRPTTDRQPTGDRQPRLDPHSPEAAARAMDQRFTEAERFSSAFEIPRQKRAAEGRIRDIDNGRTQFPDEAARTEARETARQEVDRLRTEELRNPAKYTQTLKRLDAYLRSVEEYYAREPNQQNRDTVVREAVERVERLMAPIDNCYQGVQGVTRDLPRRGQSGCEVMPESRLEQIRRHLDAKIQKIEGSYQRQLADVARANPIISELFDLHRQGLLPEDGAAFFFKRDGRVLLQSEIEAAANGQGSQRGRTREVIDDAQQAHRRSTPAFIDVARMRSGLGADGGAGLNRFLGHANDINGMAIIRPMTRDGRPVMLPRHGGRGPTAAKEIYATAGAVPAEVGPGMPYGDFLNYMRTPEGATPPAPRYQRRGQPSGFQPEATPPPTAQSQPLEVPPPAWLRDRIGAEQAAATASPTVTVLDQGPTGELRFPSYTSEGPSVWSSDAGSAAARALTDPLAQRQTGRQIISENTNQ